MNFRKLKSRLASAQKALEDAILSEMDKIARKHKVDKMIFGMYTSIIRDGKEIEIKRIQNLDYMYSDFICRAGFQGIWNSEKGWH